MTDEHEHKLVTCSSGRAYLPLLSLSLTPVFTCFVHPRLRGRFWCHSRKGFCLESSGATTCRIALATTQLPHIISVAAETQQHVAATQRDRCPESDPAATTTGFGADGATRIRSVDRKSKTTDNTRT